MENLKLMTIGELATNITELNETSVVLGTQLHNEVKCFKIHF